MGTGFPGSGVLQLLLRSRSTNLIVTSVARITQSSFKFEIVISTALPSWATAIVIACFTLLGTSRGPLLCADAGLTIAMGDHTDKKVAAIATAIKRAPLVVRI